VQPVFDAKWRKRALAGAGEALSELARAALTPLYRFCLYRVGRDEHLCEDVVQETLERAITDLEKYDPQRCGDDIFPWLTGLARNEIRRALSAHKATVSLEALWMQMDKSLLHLYAHLESEPFAEEVLQRAETREMVNAAMSQLPPQYGHVLEAKYLHGRSVSQIAQLGRTSEKAVESLLARARAAFRTTFLALAKNLSLETV
jgi:RNA polymerase sigma-70 factor (ECF subfamily)